MRIRDAEFAGTIPQTYERYLVPALFEPYAADLAARVARADASRVLEIAAGTGALTRALRRTLPTTVEIVATDLNADMLEIARDIVRLENVRFAVADASELPYETGSFDTIVCQFGLMFFPDKRRAISEIRRVLAQGGTFAFNVWADLASNPIGEIVVETCKTMFPENPPLFLARGPYGYADVATIQTLLADCGFANVRHDAVDARCRSASASDLATGMSEGSPLLNEILARRPTGVGLFRDAVARALGRGYGFEPFDAPMRAHVFSAT